jgi:hypothetical protein
MSDTLIFDPRTQLHLLPYCPDPNKQCAATDEGYFCTLKAGHPNGWHAAHASKRDDPGETLYVWPDEGVLAP